MNELHPIGWYAAKIAPHLPKEAFKPATQRLWGGLAYLVLTVSGIAAIGLLELHWLANLGIAFVIGQSFAGIGFLAHEILHGTVVKNARLRDFLGAIAFAQFSLGPKLWRKWHNMEHHANTQDEDHDPDAWATMEKFYQRRGLQWVYRLPPAFRSFCTFTSYTLFFSIHSLLMFRRFIGQFKPQERPVVWAQMLWPFAMWLSLLAWMGPVKWLFAYVLPLMFANFVVISYISSNHQLNPLTDVNDPLANSLSVMVPRWVDVLHFNFSYHTEHHIFPGMNPKWGPQVKAQVMRLWPDLYHEMPMSQAMKMLWSTPRIYHQQKDLVDPLTGVAYGTLGHGLNPSRLETRVVKLRRPEEIEFDVDLGLRGNPTQGD